MLKYQTKQPTKSDLNLCYDVYICNKRPLILDCFSFFRSILFYFSSFRCVIQTNLSLSTKLQGDQERVLNDFFFLNLFHKLLVVIALRGLHRLDAVARSRFTAMVDLNEFSICHIRQTWNERFTKTNQRIYIASHIINERIFLVSLKKSLRLRIENIKKEKKLIWFKAFFFSSFFWWFMTSWYET